mgnify:CR=1 FL=1
MAFRDRNPEFRPAEGTGMNLVEGVDYEQAWAGTVLALLAALVGGALVLPQLVWDRFLWKYFWGPVYADAHGAGCAVKADGIELYAQKAACTGVPTGAKVGYTAVNEVGYAITLLLAIGGVVLLLRRLDIGEDPGLFFALLPFMFLGGALRVVEDANNALPADSPFSIAFPWNAAIISPLIYFTMFVVTLVAVIASVWAARRGIASRYERPLFGIGTAVLLATLGYLTWMGVATAEVTFYPQIPVVVLVGASLVAGGVWWAIGRYRPGLNAGTGTMGAVVLWAHSVDGVANVALIDWGAELGLVADLVPKHPANRALIAVGRQFPESVTSVIGTAWPFLVVKIVAAVVILAIFDESVFEDSPRFSILLLIAVVAVGLGPGTRDMLRATFGV